MTNVDELTRRKLAKGKIAQDGDIASRRLMNLLLSGHVCNLNRKRSFHIDPAQTSRRTP